ncbi:hypothetical protein A1Q2_03609 [Trichosporon asahii var. asahii CBS 8904]|uniref:Fluoride ion transporter CrcB n=2 Tax=Trichosporon asahii var. asahii TaxID=189963 RepID=K1VRK4_TRIAC|nr:hypothetical protein A1Q2_03609 [Trichosporon asahii var. asahii CBS 8904]
MPIDDRAGRSSESSDPERLNTHDEAPYLAPDAPPPAEKPTFLRQTAHYAGLVLAAMIGTLIRLGVDALMEWAMLRYALSKLNARPGFENRFPIGTFIANIAATLIIGGVFAAQRRPGVGVVRCDALYALQQGFCGCLSTVSTFAVEARSIKGKRWKLLYVLGSVILGHVLILGVVGGVGWTQGYVPVCFGSD